MEKAQIESEVEGLGKIYRIERPFDESLKALREQNAGVISGRDVAYARISLGPKNNISTYGSYVKQCFLYIPKKGLFLSCESPIIEFAEDATNCHKNENEFYPDKNQVEKALAKSVRVPDNLAAIPIDRFGENEVTSFLFEDLAEKYGSFLGKHGIIEMPIYKLDENKVNSQEKPFARQVWLHRVRGEAKSSISSGLMLYYGAVRGILKKNVEHDSHKIKTSSLQDILI